jgi:hypothetical protein
MVKVKGREMGDCGDDGSMMNCRLGWIGFAGEGHGFDCGGGCVIELLVSAELVRPW